MGKPSKNCRAIYRAAVLVVNVIEYVSPSAALLAMGAAASLDPTAYIVMLFAPRRAEGCSAHHESPPCVEHRKAASRP